jgi:hypothetical protein
LKIYMEDPVANPMIAETIQLLKQLDEQIKDAEDDLISGSISELLSNFRTGLGHSMNLFQNKINEPGAGAAYNNSPAGDSLPVRRMLKYQHQFRPVRVKIRSQSKD